MNRHRRLAAVVAAALALTGCAAGAPAEPAPGDAFPRTIEVPAGPGIEATEVVVAAPPQRIAALSYETAELVAELGLADRLIAVPEAVTNPTLGNHVDELAGVPTTIASERETNAEEVIALDPDLVLLSNRHGLDADVGEVLTAVGIPVIVLPNSWSTPEEVAIDIRLVGQATGAEAAAATLAERLTDGLRGADDPDGPRPRVLVLGNQAGRVFITAGRAFPLELVRLAGGADVSGDLGIDRTGPIAAEQVVQAAPDAILLVDMNGSGRAAFEPLLENPAVGGLPAVAEGRVLLVEGRTVQALGLTETIAGLDRLRDWIGGM